MKILVSNPDVEENEILTTMFLVDHEVVVHTDLGTAKQSYENGIYDLVIIGPSTVYGYLWAEKLFRSGRGVVLLINLGDWKDVPVVSFLTNTSIDPQVFLQYAKPVMSTS